MDSLFLNIYIDNGWWSGGRAFYSLHGLFCRSVNMPVMNAMHWHRKVIEVPLIGLWCWLSPCTQLSFAVNVVKTKRTSYGDHPRPATRRSISITNQPETTSWNSKQRWVIHLVDVFWLVARLHIYLSKCIFAIHDISALLGVCEGNDGSPVESPHRGSVMWPFDIYFIVSLNRLLNNRSICRRFAMAMTLMWHDSNGCA